MEQGLQTALILIDSRLEGLAVEYNTLMEKKNKLLEGLARIQAKQNTQMPVRKVQLPAKEEVLSKGDVRPNVEMTSPRVMNKAPKMKVAGVIVQKERRTPQGYVQETHAQTFIPNVARNSYQPQSIMDHLEDYQEEWDDILEDYEQ